MAEPSTDQPQTTSAEPTEPRRGGLGTWLLWFLVALVTYVLSIGPAEKLVHAGIIPFSTALAVYSPLISVTKGCPPAKRLISWYIDLWDTPPYR
jgi:hypothetical protein